ncbi:2-dehydro-3-deoxygalactonokinase [Hymenobacter sp. BT770]|uniref:2-dehydro-3-deoxygalactonokinase n=1 Tax=Hymenobacter sp. BT770 TaxID=2886942 RepID=UPI001D0F977D|nr:2-dehydro-3-deoxygalactonokinase [Hymenobacter sp. BT770]MCC3151705.1 2-dehydro-3-deoxygalactonokinase [Hymenobacter sp. BT770]MDO3413717.1 2-dehydro-3-deoxygalactonokinase [Hymenobacter sp. BT770]
MNPTSTFLSCDWGTSSFRLRLVEREGLKILAEESSKEGNAATAELWKQAGQPPEQRVGFYLAIVQSHLKKLEEAVKTSLDDVPVVISGMASSTIGMEELPYKPLPFATDGSDLPAKIIEPTADFKHATLLISGVKSDDDVMRGEETQLVGCQFANTAEQQMFLHPGTHAKHVVVQHGQAVALKTYMTGEFFSLLSKQAILAASVAEGGQLEDGTNRQWFEKGVQDSQQDNLLHNAFLVRTNDLFKKASKPENFFYLSGLLIGSECQDLLASLPASITLAGEPVLVAHYSEALRVLGIADKCPVTTKTAVEVTLQGQSAVLQHSRINQQKA